MLRQRRQRGLLPRARAATAARRRAGAAAGARTRCDPACNAALRWAVVAAAPAPCPDKPVLAPAALPARPPVTLPCPALQLQLLSAAKTFRDAYQAHVEKFGSKQSALFDAGRRRWPPRLPGRMARVASCQQLAGVRCLQGIPAGPGLAASATAPLLLALPVLQPLWQTRTQSCPYLQRVPQSMPRCAPPLCGCYSHMHAVHARCAAC